MTLDDFEWVEEGFDIHILIHKTREMTAAIVKNFNGWYIQVNAYPKGAEQVAEHIDNLEAAKAIAAIHVNQYMEGYPDASNYSERTPKLRPKKIPAGVFKLDRVRP